MSDASDLLKRLYRRMQEIAHQEVVAIFGQAWRGGKFDGSYVTRATPATSGVPAGAANRRGTVYPDDTTITMTADGEISVAPGVGGLSYIRSVENTLPAAVAMT